MSTSSLPKQTAFELGMRQAVENQEEAKPPRRNSTPMLFGYILIFGMFLPGLFMGLGNFIICPFSVPNGWQMPGSEARGRCDQVGAQKAAIIYTCINIFYGVFIGYAIKHLIRRCILSIRGYFEKRKRIIEQGRKTEVDRIAKEKLEAEKNKIRLDLQKTTAKLQELAERGEGLEDTQDAMNGNGSYRTSSSKSSSRSRRGRNYEGRGNYPERDQVGLGRSSVPPMPYVQRPMASHQPTQPGSRQGPPGAPQSFPQGQANGPPHPSAGRGNPLNARMNNSQASVGGPFGDPRGRSQPTQPYVPFGP